MVFSERSEEEQAKGFGKLLSYKDNLMLMCLLGDVFFSESVPEEVARRRRNNR